MADIVPSLFGLTPEMYQQRQSAQADEMALQLAQLSPMQQAQFAISRGAYGLAGALGAPDPQLQMISTRNSIARQIDYNNPESIMQGVNALTQAGDTTGAMQLADVARRMESEMAQRNQRLAAAQASLAQAGRERVQTAPTTSELTNARAIASLAGPEGSPEYRAAFDAEYRRLTAPKEVREPTTPELTNARVIASQAGPAGSPEYNAAFMAEYNRLTAPKTDKLPSVGSDREAVALEVYNVPFASLTPEQRAAVNKRVEAQQAAKTPKVEVRNIMPGDTKLADIPAFRASVQKTIEPQIRAITASEQALQAINDSLATGNFASYRAAQVQFAKAIAGAGDLSQKELKAAGADPSLLGGTADYLSTLFSSTPTADTQRKIRSTLQAIQTVARKQGQAEVDQQIKIAARSPGYNMDAVNDALKFPQLQGPTASAAPAAAPIYARNPRTNERIMSTDGGATWTPVR